MRIEMTWCYPSMKLPNVSCCHLSLSDDEQDPCWLLLALNDKNGRPCFHTRGAMSPIKLPMTVSSTQVVTGDASVVKGI